jgi:heat shock protein HtpX
MNAQYSHATKRHIIFTILTLLSVCLVTVLYVGALLTGGAYVFPLILNTLFNEYLPVPIALGAPLVALLIAAALASYIYLGPRLEHRLVSAAHDPAASDRLEPIVARLSQQFDVPTPNIKVIQESATNAYTIGYSQSSATVIITVGLLETLSEDEIEVVLAHELAHIANRDMVVMSVTATGIILCGVLYEWMAGMGDSAHQRGDVADFMIQGLIAGIFLSITILFWVPIHLLVSAFSRSRELVADRAAGMVVGNPAVLVSALQQLESSVASPPEEDLRALEPALSPFYFISPQSSSDTSESRNERSQLMLSADTVTRPSSQTTRAIDETILAPLITHPAITPLFTTHPASETRIRRIEQLIREREGE